MEKVNIVGVTFIFHDNYMEVIDRRGLAGFLFPKKTTVLYRSIASVDANTATGKLIIETTGGKNYRYAAGFSAGKVKDKILSYL